MAKTKGQESYIIDTCKIANRGTYLPGAIVYTGRRKSEVLQWKDHEFDTPQAANAFVRNQFANRAIREARNEGELRNA